MVSSVQPAPLYLDIGVPVLHRAAVRILHRQVVLRTPVSGEH
jgi:hypothetical protein